MSFKILEGLQPHLIRRVKQGTTFSLNIQVEPLGKSLPLPVNGSKEAFPCSKLFSINYC